ncbi:uncharacterized protein Z518_02010 [Rhinocladiella mackenziei CBS 650.93]|uniref:YTH domain-containing protein n=1 Tax=Rhinocladiella mackenziei CBS 650.93 TaxID=1442369 RepID=A0A0D2FYG5_9EURO|nr:uncharacterized protein Z518_02010 [Rhinocladiella mackenziei CBS 650.93]KIX07357.1 hypothetical protein Z518_02010 [Rhinocladiella mackenziei CBS 650.93]
MNDRGCEKDPFSSTPRNAGRQGSRFWGEYALWVGNIPPKTTVMNLRDYFLQPNPQDLLSISYNPDAKYAFVNFNSETGRVAAIQQAASRLFEGKRLDCRIRQDSISRSTKVNYGLNQTGPQRSISICCDQPNNLRHKVEELSHFPESDRSQWGKDKFYIIKSVSLQALYQSLEQGQWYIPKRHIERLNHAFQTANKVYFLFSLNGSGEFFGYASMMSEVRAVEEPPPTSHQSNDIHQIDSSSSEDVSSYLAKDQQEETQTSFELRSRTPSLTSSDSSTDSLLGLGSISYEPERRRIIWEATRHQSTCLDEGPRDHSSLMRSSAKHSSDPSSTPTPTRLQYSPFSGPGRPVELGNLLNTTSLLGSSGTGADQLLSKLERFSSPCRIKWHSTENIPFDEVRGLKNSWNSNNEIHIARNVTAVEPRAGTALIKFWREKEEARRMKVAVKAAWNLF